MLSIAIPSALVFVLMLQREVETKYIELETHMVTVNNQLHSLNSLINETNDKLKEQLDLIDAKQETHNW